MNFLVNSKEDEMNGGYLIEFIFFIKSVIEKWKPKHNVVAVKIFSQWE